MKCSIRICQAVVLTMLLILTGQTMAQARGMMPASDKMVLCTGMGPRVIYVDDQGNPTAAPHVCPDCAFNALQGLVPAGVALAGLVSRQTIISVEVEHLLSFRVITSPQARGPPKRT